MKHTDFTQEKTDLQTPSAFYRSFENEHNPLKVLLKIFQGNYWTLLKSVFFYVLQYSPVVVLPIVTSNIINIATYAERYDLSALLINAGVMALLLLQNVLTTYLCTKFRSLAIRRVELGLRPAMA